MNKANRRRRIRGKETSNKRSRARLLLVISVAFLLIVGVFLIWRTKPLVSDFKPQVVGGPRLKVDKELFDYGKVKLGTDIVTIFRLQNVGDQSLKIVDEPRVEIIEGC